jgi:putative transposase
MIPTQVDGARKALISLRKKGYKVGNLQFTSYGQYRTLVYNQSGFKIEKQGYKNFLWLSKVGFIEIIKHRELTGNIKQVVVSKSKSGKWHALVTCENNGIFLPKIDFGKSVGIDVGIKNFTYDSLGSATPNPLNLKKLLKPLAKIQKKVARRQKGSSNRAKSVRWYQLIHERIANRRKDFLHKLSRRYAENHDVAFVEKLAKLNMVKNKRFARNVMDSGWGIFCNMLDYKCKMLVEVPAKNTSVDCSRCGSIVPKSIAVRIHSCNVCGLILDRDHNASINILKKGLEIFGMGSGYDSRIYELPQELREVTLVEMPTASLKQEQTTNFCR